MTGSRTAVSSSFALAFAFAVFLAGLAVVVWRQSVTLDSLEELSRVRRERSALRAEHAMKLREIQQLESRGVIVQRARAELGMDVPEGDAILIVPSPR